MQVNPQQLLDGGYIILRQVVPPAELDKLRTSYEVLVERQRAIWAGERKPDDPPGGVWEASPQPRLVAHKLIDRATANAVEFWLHENTLGVARQLMRAPEVAVTEMFMMCSPVRDHGPARWHRDTHPDHQAPLEGLQQDLLANGPAYVQWNIPLYDDSVLWVVPGSHRRPNTEEETSQLLEDPRKPLPGGIPVELKAGDGVVYINLILHWGSAYNAKLRRTIHGGHRSVGGPLFPYIFNGIWDLDRGFTEHLSPAARATFERCAQLQAKERDMIESIFRAMLDRDAAAVLTGLAALHPGETGRIVCIVLLSKLTTRLMTLKRPDVTGQPVPERARAISVHSAMLNFYEDIARRFTSSEVDTLWQRFATLDTRLQSPTEQTVPWSPSAPTRYAVYEMPVEFDVEDFIASWN